ncbi:molybdate ABC transporter substrate-binding protein [Candidatus Symbiobacter mobilis]|uniref:ABC-type molybdate transporter substrate-binding protein n=1 Tax=Candidatus Symbiobacter mobilis CR TaxID=946483 RepID=U5NAF9_9BURK|nr:molybdate ABC transporter substrate-binding protein [Candidatus Symbiobacter mobilis]AGX88305.1 ABC-type molybdate transporter substrate-binding protein [Candidatus Symbiobacter mobilis CR]
MLTKFFGLCVAAILILTSPVRAQDSEAGMLLYCGITMVKPMTEITKLFTKREGVRILVSQGGSEDLYQSAKKSGQGDWYLPGEPSFRDKHIKEGLLDEFVNVGYNQLALVVQKGNPKNVKADPREMLRKDLKVILGNAESGSVGKESQEVLDSLGIYAEVVKSSSFLASDSRSLMNAMKKGEGDVTLSWRASVFFGDLATKLDVVDLSPKVAKPQALLLNLLKSSKNPELARKFMQLAASEEGQAIFRKHGFLDNKTAVAR